MSCNKRIAIAVAITIVAIVFLMRAPASWFSDGCPSGMNNYDGRGCS